VVRGTSKFWEGSNTTSVPGHWPTDWPAYGSGLLVSPAGSSRFAALCSPGHTSSFRSPTASGSDIHPKSSYMGSETPKTRSKRGAPQHPTPHSTPPIIPI